MDNYEKKYNEALERAKKLATDLPNGRNDRLYHVDDLEYIFPELVESEDEKIRKYIKNFVEVNREVNLPPDDADRMIAWLEKQGDIDEDDLDFAKRLSKMRKVQREKSLDELIEMRWSVLKDAYKITKEIFVEQAKFFFEVGYEKQGEQNPTDNDNKFIRMRETKPKDISEFLDRLTTVEQEFLWEHIAKIRELDKEEHNSAWSEEDETVLNNLIYALANDRISNNRDEYVNWLKSLRPQPKTEWSKEDIEMIDWLIRCCEEEHKELCNDRYGHQEIVSDLKRDCRKKWNWLESLKDKVVPKSHWKPNGDQLDALYDMLCSFRKESSYSNRDDIANIIETLYEQLKVIGAERS